MLRSRFWLKMFQMALLRRDRFVTGWTPRPSGVGSENPNMPCWKGRFPVAMEVHSIGERGGCMVAICPAAPCSTRRCVACIFPASMSGWMTFQSAASHPTRRTLGEPMRNGGGGLLRRNELLDDEYKMLLRARHDGRGIREVDLFGGLNSGL